MLQYFFILGKNPTISTAEIIAVLNKLNSPIVIKTLSVEVLVISTEIELQLQNLMKVLGGTIKVGIIVQDMSVDEDEENFKNLLSGGNLVQNFLTKTEGKLHIGISIYNGGAEESYLKEMTKQLKSLNMTVKENLQKEGLKAGFVKIKERFLSSVSVEKNKLLEKGVEIVLILTNDKIYVGKTIAVQEFESFSFRDYGRPQRDTKSGIIPPKLARMMINLVAIDREETLIDPFCGSGTIIQEAVLLGYKNIVGCDISERAVSDTQVNTEWLFNNFSQIDKSSFNIKVYSSDIRFLSDNIPQDSVDAIVSEPYLGPPLTRQLNINDAQRIFQEVGRLYVESFVQFHKVLKKTGKVIFIFPTFEIKGRMYFVPVLDKIKEMGFTQTEYFPKKLLMNNTLKITSRNTILYGSREQFVKREIISLQKE